MSWYREVFGRSAAATGTAPGRVNLLGEHTDYNDGFVLPTPLPLSTTVALAPGDGPHHRFYSSTLDQHLACPLEAGTCPGFGAYLLGSIRVIEETAGSLPPLDIAVASSVPVGAGLSSSAALEVATLRALCRFTGVSLDAPTVAKLAQRVEIAFAGVRCGIMDQMAASVGRPGHLLFLDTRSLEWREAPLPPGSEVLVVDSGVPRTLASSAYNDRRAACEAAARRLGVRALRDVDDLSSLDPLEELLARRARHVITENARVLEAARGVTAERFGILMNASHTSLRDDFEVSTPRVDILVGLLQETRGCFGARMTGAGFGGAVVALVAKGEARRVADEALTRYAAAGGQGRRLFP